MILGEAPELHQLWGVFVFHNKARISYNLAVIHKHASQDFFPMTLKSRISFSVSDYEAMHQSGFIPEHLRVELLDGEIVKMSPIGPRHASVTMKLQRLLQKILGDEVTYFVQSPLKLNDNSMPQPDLFLVRNRDDDYERALPTPADVLLLIEVCETSGDYDREGKLPRYAEAGILEVWIVDTVTQTIEQYITPAGTDYLDEETFAVGQQVNCTTLPELCVEVASIVRPSNS